MQLYILIITLLKINIVISFIKQIFSGEAPLKSSDLLSSVGLYFDSYVRIYTQIYFLA